MLNVFFSTEAQLKKLIDDYFDYIEGECHETEITQKEGKTTSAITEKTWDRHPEPPTLTGFTLFLGFNSRQAFEDYCGEGEFARAVNRGLLRIQACYEKKLHGQSATGAIFALKSMGWNEKSETSAKDVGSKTLRIELVETGPKVASTEKEVEL